MKKVRLLFLLGICLLGVVAAVASAESEVFTYGDYEYVVLEDGTAEIVKYNGQEGNLLVPDMMDGYKVTRIGDKAFFYCKDLNNIVLPESLLHIGDKAFGACMWLNSITLPNGLVSIGAQAFNGCYLLCEISLQTV